MQYINLQFSSYMIPQNFFDTKEFLSESLQILTSNKNIKRESHDLYR